MRRRRRRRRLAFILPTPVEVQRSHRLPDCATLCPHFHFRPFPLTLRWPIVTFAIIKFQSCIPLRLHSLQLHRLSSSHQRLPIIMKGGLEQRLLSLRNCPFSWRIWRAKAKMKPAQRHSLALLTTASSLHTLFCIKLCKDGCHQEQEKKKGTKDGQRSTR